MDLREINLKLKVMDIAMHEEGVASSLRTANRTTGCVTVCGTKHGSTDLILL